MLRDAKQLTINLAEEFLSQDSQLLHLNRAFAQGHVTSTQPKFHHVVLTPLHADMNQYITTSLP